MKFKMDFEGVEDIKLDKLEVSSLKNKEVKKEKKEKKINKNILEDNKIKLYKKSLYNFIVLLILYISSLFIFIFFLWILIKGIQFALKFF